MKFVRAMFGALALVVLTHVSAAELADQPKLLTDSVVITGVVQHTLKLNVDDLRKFPEQQINDLTLTRQSGAAIGNPENLKGVRLRDILEKAVIVTHDHNDVKKMAIVATASDGYKAVFSWNEIFNSPIGDGVVVYFEKDGKPLGDDEGRIAMISSKDTSTGPRHVKWLQTIEVMKIAD